MALYLGNQQLSLTVPSALKHIVMRPDAELIQTYTLDHMTVDDDEVTIPEYSTSAKTLLAGQNLSPTIAVDHDNYNYLIVEKTLTIPTYDIDTKAKGRQDYSCGIAIYEIVKIPGSTFKSRDGTATITADAFSIPVSSYYRQIYYSSATAIAAYTASTYGIHQVFTAPAISATVLTVKTPSLYIRGSTTYLTSTYYNALTDWRNQCVIDVYRAPKDNLNFDGWGNHNISLELFDDIKNNNFVLR